MPKASGPERALGILAILAAAACGPSPANHAEAPTGTLVVTIKQGPELVPFKPMVARTYRANEQIAAILGRSIRIEIDGALMPQTEEGAADVVARIVEQVARDLDGLKRDDPRAIDLARSSFARLVVRYAPAEAASREGRFGRGRAQAKLDASTKTIDVVRGEARWLALEPGEVAGVLGRAFDQDQDARYADVLPASLPRSEHRPWFEYHARGMGRRSKVARVGAIEPLRVRGMVELHGIAQRGQDEALARDVRKWLVGAADAFAQTYHHHAAEAEGAAADSPYRQAERAWIGWAKSELPRMTLDERGEIARHLLVIDFRKGQSDRDRYASYAFPGLDPMAFTFQAIDAWTAAGRPTKRADVHPYFDQVVCPATAETKNGQLHTAIPGRCEGDFYRWALADRAREDVFVRDVTSRLAEDRDGALALALFKNAHRVLSGESEHLRFLRRFESTPKAWRVGADIHREYGFRPSEAMLDESRRHWREVDHARPHALFWFARHIDGSYHPDTDWPDLLQGRLADADLLARYLDLGWDAFQLLPVAWPALAKNGARVRVITGWVRPLFEQDIRPAPGQRGVTGTLAAIGSKLCEEGAAAEVAELRGWATREIAKRPGAGLSDVLEATAPAACAEARARGQRAPREAKPRATPKTPKRPPREDLFPPKAGDR